VIVDVCKTHGTWFDADELRRVVEFVQHGGMEKLKKLQGEERRRELDAQKKEARDARRLEISRAASQRRYTDNVAGWAIEVALESFFELW
jgi:hypothetical protein